MRNGVEIRQIVSAVLEKAVPSLRLLDLSIEEELDQPEDCIFVNIVYGPARLRLGIDDILRVRTEVRARLLAIGVGAFPVLTYYTLKDAHETGLAAA